MSTRFGSLICLAALALVVALPGAAPAADDSGAGAAPVTLSDEQIAALEDASAQNSGDQSVFSDVSDFVTDNAPYFIIGIVVLAAIIAGIFIMRGRSRSGGAGDAAAAGGQPSAAEMKRRKRAAIQRSREEERLRRKGGREARGAAGQPVPPAAAAAGVAAGAGVVAGTGAGPSSRAPAAIDPVAAEKQGARDQRTAAAAVARTGGAVPAPPSPSQTAPSAAVTAAGSAAVGAAAGFAAGSAANDPAPAPAASSAEPDTVVTGAPKSAATPEAPATPEATATQPPPMPAQPEPASAGPDPGVQAGQLAAGLAAGAAGGALAGRAASSSASPPDEQAPEQAVDDAEARLRAKVDEIKAGQAGGVQPEAEAGTPDAPAAEDQLRRVEQLERNLGTSEPPPRSTPGLAAVERRLSADSEERDRILRAAEDRLRRIEQRAEDAERRAAFAERLAQLKIEESDRERRLNDVVSGIDRAEERAREAEARAESAEKAAAAALEERSAPRANVPESIGSGTPTADGPGSEFPASPAGQAPGRPEPSAGRGTPAGTSGSGEAGTFAPRESQLSSPEPSPTPEAPEYEGFEPAAAAPRPGAIDLNRATFEDLREADLSVTQATRVLAYRERFGGYRSVDDLEKVPGFPEDLIESLRDRITV